MTHPARGVHAPEDTPAPERSRRPARGAAVGAAGGSARAVRESVSAWPSGLDSNVVEAVERLLPLAQSPARAALVARALDALAELAPQLSDAAVAHAIGARSGAKVLAQILEQTPALADLTRDDPLAAARLRGLRAKQDLLQAEGGTWRAEQVAAHLALSRQQVDNRRRAGRLIGLETGRRGFAYPVWQFDHQGVLAGLEAVLQAMPVRDPWGQASFFLSGDPRLGGERPLDALRRGRLEDVRRAASGYGEHSAA